MQAFNQPVQPCASCLCGPSPVDDVRFSPRAFMSAFKDGKENTVALYVSQRGHGVPLSSVFRPKRQQITELLRTSAGRLLLSPKRQQRHTKTESDCRYIDSRKLQALIEFLDFKLLCSFKPGTICHRPRDPAGVVCPSGNLLFGIILQMDAGSRDLLT